MSDMHDTGNAIIAANGIRSIPGTSDSFKAAVDNIIASLERSARIDAACLLRSEINVPKWPTHWEKVPNAGCFFTDADGHWIRAKDYRPNESGPITLPIVDA